MNAPTTDDWGTKSATKSAVKSPTTNVQLFFGAKDCQISIGHLLPLGRAQHILWGARKRAWISAVAVNEDGLQGYEHPRIHGPQIL